ncbi:MAG: hypothetical protein WAR83_01490 [Flavobacteriales bacterium]|nr:hypothetical protein [Flavobacteriales bacterium]
MIESKPFFEGMTPVHAAPKADHGTVQIAGPVELVDHIFAVLIGAGQ